MLTGRLLRLGIVVVVVATSFLGWQWRRWQSARRLRELDAGKRCVACDSVSVGVVDGVATCRQCGHRFALAALRAVHIRPSDIDDMTKPEGQ